MATHSLPESFQLDVPSGSPYTFHKYQEIKDWAEKELEAWVTLEDDEPAVTSAFRPFPKQLISHIKNLISVVSEAITDDRAEPEKWDKVAACLGLYENGSFPVSYKPRQAATLLPSMP